MVVKVIFSAFLKLILILLKLYLQIIFIAHLILIYLNKGVVMISLPKKDNNSLRFDFILFLSVIALSIFGIIVLSSATSNIPGGSRMLIIQIISIVLGMGVCILISFFDYNLLKSLGGFFYLFGVLLLVLVLLIGQGGENWGSTRWLMIPVIGITFQPSEVAKIFFVILISKHFERHSTEKNKSTIFKIAIITMIPVLLILRQPDGGTAATFLFILFVIAFIHGLPYKYIFVSISSAIAAFPLIWMFVLKEYQKNRLRTFINPELDPLNTGYQVLRAKMTVGSGQLWGQGLFNGTQSQSSQGVPVRESDFIFTVIAEELGFIGSTILILLIMFILFRCIYIAWNSKDLYGSYLAAGLTAVLSFNFIQNIGMNIAILPITGVPLPFVSAGGSAMITYFIAIGIIMSVSMRRNKNMFA
ncbi:UNVERIFIED_CONTAM: rod shape determining protein RodA [Acetivibrio alkalicellulosi]